jgi:hypothetical protein
MTLIFSVATEDRIINATDRLVTLPDGSVFDSKTNKTILVWGYDALFLLRIQELPLSKMFGLKMGWS